MHSGFTALRSAAPMNLRRTWQNLTLSDAVEKDVRRVDALWSEARERFGKGGDFLFGAFSAADMMYAPVATRFLTYGIDLSATAAAYRDAVRAHPLVNAWYEEAAKEDQILSEGEIGDDATRLG